MRGREAPIATRTAISFPRELPRARIKSCRHDPDHSESIAAEQDFSSDDLCTASKTAHPQLMAQDGHTLAIAAIFLGKKVAAERRMYSQNLKIFCRRWHPTDMFRFRPCSEVEAYVGVARYLLEKLAVFPQLFQLVPRQIHFIGICSIGFR